VPVGWPLKFRVSGPDQDKTRELAQSFAQLLGRNPNTRNINYDWNENAKVIKRWLAKGKEHALAKAFRQLELGDVAEITEDGKPCVGEKSDSLQRAISLFRQHKAIADRLGLELYVYEGGTHFDHGNDEEHKKFLLEMVRDDRMRVLYGKLFAGFRDVGGTIFNVWGGVGPGSVWTNARTLSDRAHPKYRADTTVGYTLGDGRRVSRPPMAPASGRAGHFRQSCLSTRRPGTLGRQRPAHR